MPDLMRLLRRDRIPQPRDARKQERTQHDRALAERLAYLFRRTLADQHPTSLHFYVRQGTVTLSGPVAHEAERTRLIALVERLPGLEGIVDRLYLATPSAPDHDQGEPQEVPSPDALPPGTVLLLPDVLEAAPQVLPNACNPEAPPTQTPVLLTAPKLPASDVPVLPPTENATRRKDKSARPRRTAANGQKRPMPAPEAKDEPAASAPPEPSAPATTPEAAAETWEHLALLLAEPSLATLASDPVLQGALVELASDISAAELEALLNDWSAGSDDTPASPLPLTA